MTTPNNAILSDGELKTLRTVWGHAVALDPFARAVEAATLDKIKHTPIATERNARLRERDAFNAGWDAKAAGLQVPKAVARDAAYPLPVKTRTRVVTLSNGTTVTAADVTNADLIALANLIAHPTEVVPDAP